MRRTAPLLAGLAGLAAALGAGSMYFLDPQRGARRRARIARRMRHGGWWISEVASDAAHTLGRRAGDYGETLRTAFGRKPAGRTAALRRRLENYGSTLRGAWPRRTFERMPSAHVRHAHGGTGAALGGMAAAAAKSRTHAHEKGSTMNRAFALLAGTGIGAAVMYLYDPERGERRRALLRDQMTRGQRRLTEAAGTTATGAQERARGYRYSLRSAFMRAAGTSDEVVRERVRAAIGRAVTRPGSIEAQVSDGVVTLSGPVFAREVPLLIDRVLDVRGVRDVVNRLEVREEAGAVPGLQGGGATAGEPPPELPPRHWSPAARLAAGAAGAGASLRLFRRGLLNKAIGVGGLALLTRAATNLEMRQLAGVARRRAITVHKTIRINAPIERVFELWSRAENFPQFMTHVREVTPTGGDARNQRWHWKVRGTSGIEFEFDTVTTGYEENRFIAWRSEPGAWVQHSGQVRFQSNPDRSTTANVTLSYHPVAGAAGHVIAKLLGDDPKKQLDDDLMRMKSYLETGVRPHDAAATPRPGL
jgi:uncharacterized membrane protein/osmotically-inducible protein OsmY